jgi:hypothetical protein
VATAETDGSAVRITEADGSTDTVAVTVVSSVGVAETDGSTDAVAKTVVSSARITTAGALLSTVATGEPAGSTLTNTEAAVAISGLFGFLPAGNSIGRDTACADIQQKNIYSGPTLKYKSCTA